jgi:hypothetical protein
MTAMKSQIERIRPASTEHPHSPVIELLKTAGHGASEGAAHGLGELAVKLAPMLPKGVSAGSKAASVGAGAASVGAGIFTVGGPVAFLVESYYEGARNSRDGANRAQRAQAARGYADTLARALMTTPAGRCVEAGVKSHEAIVAAGDQLPPDQQPAYRRGADAAARFASTLTPEERVQLAKALALRPGPSTGNGVLDTSMRIQSFAGR